MRTITETSAPETPSTATSPTPLQRVAPSFGRIATLESLREHLQWAIELATPGALIVVDNIARAGRVLDPAPDDQQAHAIRDMFQMMGDHPRLDTAAVQTVGTKGWDGFALALVR